MTYLTMDVFLIHQIALKWLDWKGLSNNW